ncbi:hypothetical protein TNIN_286971, partial [Trichonephila inaurata madagascariensis]
EDIRLRLPESNTNITGSDWRATLRAKEGKRPLNDGLEAEQ